jgi:hypothetical protein
VLDSIAITAAGLLSNYAAPGNMSLPLRAVYMHRVHQLHYKDFLPIAGAGFVFSTGLYGILIGLIAIGVGTSPSGTYTGAVLFFFVVGLVLVLGLLFRYARLPLVGGWIEKVLFGWRQLCSSKSAFALWLAVVAVLAILEVALFYSIIRIIDIPLSLGETAIIVLAKENSIFFRITPGAFGIAEGVQVFFATQFGVGAPAILLAALIARVIELICLVILSFIFTTRLAKKVASNNSPGYGTQGN